MKYKLIHQTTNEEHLCDKVSIDGYDYYALKTDIKLNDYISDGYKVIKWVDNQSLLGRAKVIATNNPQIDMPKVVDEVMELAKEVSELPVYRNIFGIHTGVVIGYNKCKETHPFTAEDMIEFAVFYQKHQGKSLEYWGKDLFKIWQEQQPKTLYYK